MKKTILLILFFTPFFSYSQNKTEKYIKQYSSIAVGEMNKYSIPASITLAQAILESGNGESRLAVEGKNHFGIKCHSNWAGKTIIQDDDTKGECFRKYSSVHDSYRDHSLFLTERGRYSFLFEYSITDYKKWAKGLKKAGYATNPKYSSLLIDLIEKYDLVRFDVSYISKRYFYFAHIYGIPYLNGLGVYYFNSRSVFSMELNTSFLFSESNIGYNFEFYNNIYTGLNSGILYFPSVNNQYIPLLGTEFMYKRNSILFKAGVQFPLEKIQYQLIPYFRLVYLID